jgi:hypothetical protein
MEQPGPDGSSCGPSQPGRPEWVCARPTPLRIPGLLLARSSAGPRRRQGRSSSHALHHDPGLPTKYAITRRRTAAPLDRPDLMGVTGHTRLPRVVKLLIKPAAPVPGPLRQPWADKSAQDTTRVSHSKGHAHSHRSQPGSSPNRGQSHSHSTGHYWTQPDRTQRNAFPT